MHRESKVICFGAINVKKKLLEALFVDPKYAGKGVGKKMLDYLVERATASGIKSLRVNSSLNAANFYLRNGFIELEKSEFITKSGVVLKSIVMEHELI